MAAKREKPALEKHKATVQLGISDGSRRLDLGRAVLEWHAPAGAVMSKSTMFWGGYWPLNGITQRSLRGLSFAMSGPCSMTQETARR